MFDPRHMGDQVAARQAFATEVRNQIEGRKLELQIEEQKREQEARRQKALQAHYKNRRALNASEGELFDAREDIGTQLLLNSFFTIDIDGHDYELIGYSQWNHDKEENLLFCHTQHHREGKTEPGILKLFFRPFSKKLIECELGDVSSYHFTDGSIDYAISISV